MMVSLFEQVGVRTSAMPVDLVTAGGRGVELLEFWAEGERVAPIAAPVGEPVDERAERMGVMLDAAREETAAAVRRECAEEMEARVEEERERVRALAAEFARDRQRYFAAAEKQVVGLALAIARRVLAREVAADEMHLLAVVRAALSRVEGESGTVLRVCAAEVEQWVGVLDVAVVADDGMGAGECVLETCVGRVEMGVEVQLREVERGFGLGGRS